jgi:hypothetical protein
MGVDEHRSCHVLELSDPSFGDSILMMRIDASKREDLSLFVTRIMECLVRKGAVVCVVVLDTDTTCGCVPLEGLLGLDGLFS